MSITLIKQVSSKLDNTQKFLFKTSEDETIEISYIDKNDGKDILVVPTQHGCDQGCVFCHLTGAKIQTSNLDGYAISESIKKVHQILNLKESKPLLISFMGCGEPLCNIDAVMDVMGILTDFRDNIRYALATILPQNSQVQFTQLAGYVKCNNINLKIHYSLHFTSDTERVTWMPSADDLKPSLALLNWYQQLTGNDIEIHYTLIEDLNDSQKDIGRLSILLDKSWTLKLLTFNPISSRALLPSNKLKDYQDILTNLGFKVEVYTPPGRDIGASCGQFNIKDYLPQDETPKGKVKIGCTCCKETGLIRCEDPVTAYICHVCKGLGYRFIDAFTGRKELRGITRVIPTSSNVCQFIDGDLSIPLEDWIAKKPFPITSQIKEKRCPASWTDLTHTSRPDFCKFKDCCYNSCSKWSEKDICWEKWDKEKY